MKHFKILLKQTSRNTHKYFCYTSKCGRGLIFTLLCLVRIAVALTFYRLFSLCQYAHIGPGAQAISNSMNPIVICQGMKCTLFITNLKKSMEIYLQSVMVFRSGKKDGFTLALLHSSNPPQTLRYPWGSSTSKNIAFVQYQKFCLNFLIPNKCKIEASKSL
jgi:hypothetical protein